MTLHSAEERFAINRAATISMYGVFKGHAGNTSKGYYTESGEWIWQDDSDASQVPPTTVGRAEGVSQESTQDS